MGAEGQVEHHAARGAWMTSRMAQRDLGASRRSDLHRSPINPIEGPVADSSG
jgi:hypothetical protein